MKDKPIIIKKVNNKKVEKKKVIYIKKYTKTMTDANIWC